MGTLDPHLKTRPETFDCCPLGKGHAMNPLESVRSIVRQLPWAGSVVILAVLLLGLVSSATCQPRAPGGGSRNLVVITDLEPDDRIAIHLLRALFEPEDFRFFGTTVMHAGRKAALVRRLLDQLGFESVPVFQGTGGTGADYPDIASSRAARLYAREGKSLLSDEALAAISAAPPSSGELKKAIARLLRQSKDVEFVMLAPPVDLMAVLAESPELAASIRHIHVMGGWAEVKTPSGTALFTTYNWNMGPAPSAAFVRLSRIPMTLYSSHMIKPSFNGGSINATTSPRLMQTLDQLKAKLPSLVDQEVAGTSWDSHLVEQIPPLANVIGCCIGRQFTPADPIVVVGMAEPKLITQSRRMELSIDLNGLDPARGYPVAVKEAPDSSITLVDRVDPQVFDATVIRLMESLPAKLQPRN